MPDLEMLGLALEGTILVSCARVPEGMRRLDEATVTAMQSVAQIPISSAWASCFLVSACSLVRDFDRAAQWCDHIADFAARYGSRYMLAFCRAEYGAVHLWRGQWRDAEQVLEASVEDFSRSRPAMVAGPLIGLAELRRRQGRKGEARLLLDRAGTSPQERLCRGRLALDDGDARRAVELAERALRQLPDRTVLDRAPALELLVRGHVARDDRPQAAAAVAALRELQQTVQTGPITAAADLAEGLLAAAESDHERARVLLEDAVDGFERGGGRFDAAQAKLELATSLMALRRPEEARREATAALTELEQLGAGPEAARARRLLQTSTHGLTDRESSLQDLTQRERQVLELLADGLTNRQIASRLSVSEHTVHRHVTSILCKLGLPSRTAAAAHAVRTGLQEGGHAQ